MHTEPFSNPHSSKAYSPAGLSLYDALVVHGFAPWIWGCKPQRLLDHYNQFISANHVDVGVGTGYFLDHCQFPGSRPRLGLIDQRQSCLNYTAQRLSRYQPQVWRRDITVPVDVQAAPFDSLCLGGVLHCLDGSQTDKGRVLDNLLPLLSPGARVFGYTLIQDRVHESLRRRALNSALNKLKMISNRDDSEYSVRRQLCARFSHCRVVTQGTFLLFSGRFCP